MHEFKIEVFAYSESGAPGQLVSTRYADSPEQARLICQDYDMQKYDNGMKMYKTNLHLLYYKLCADKAAFFAQFQA